MTLIQRISLLNNNINVSRVPFKEAKAVSIVAPVQPYNNDTFVTNPLEEKYMNSQAIMYAIETNPTIQKIAQKYNLKADLSVLDDLKNGHLMDTRLTVAQMYSALPLQTKTQINLKNLQEAAMLHDIGKIFMKDIVDKNGALTPKEREIMELHPILSAELLKSLGANKEVVRLVKYHHQTPLGTGYPAISRDFEYTPALDILHAADIKTALIEKRAYKPSMTNTEAMTIISDEVQRGNLSPLAYEAAKKAV